MAFQERVEKMGAKFIVAHCPTQGSISFSLWKEVSQGVAANTVSHLEMLAVPIGLGKEANSFYQIQQELASWLASCAIEQPLVIFWMNFTGVTLIH